MFWLAAILVPYTTVILTGWYRLRRSHSPGEGSSHSFPVNDLPEITVVVPSRNEEENIQSLISDLLNQDYPEKNLQVILVDDNSTDSTSEILNRAAEGSAVITYLKSEGNGKKAAINSALKIARGDLILTSDADCTIPPGWVSSYAGKFISEEPDLMIGRVDPVASSGITGRFMELEFLSLQAITGGMVLTGRPIMCNGANLGFRRSFVKDYLRSTMGRIKSGEDVFLMHYIKKMGGKIIWMEEYESLVKTKLPGRLKGFLSQRRRWASKSIYYKDFDTIVTGLATLSANLLIATITILLLFRPHLWILFITLAACKAIPDLLILSRYLRLGNKSRLLVWFLPTALLYPFYILTTTIIGLVPDRRW